MDIELLHRTLGWCAVINIAGLLWWWLMFVFARDWIYRLHSRWFRLSPERFDSIHYAGMVFYKIATLVLFVVPWLVLHIVR